MGHTTDLETLSDSELVVRASQGDDRALGRVYDLYGASAYSIAFGILRDHQDAEDAVARAFTQVWKQSERFEPGRSGVAAWLHTIVRSRALDLHRARRRRLRAVEGVGNAPSIGWVPAGPEEHVAHAERREQVARSLEELSAEQRQAVVLAYYKGMTQSEIAEHLDEPLGTVKSRLRAAMRKLRLSLVGLQQQVQR